jgi:outer membrane protein TolC
VQDLRGRDVNIEPVKAFAEKLSAAAPSPVVFDPADGLSLPEAEAVALWYNPDLRLARIEAEGAGAVAKASGAWADPELGFETGEKEVEGAAPGFLHDAGSSLDRSWINLASLSITIPLSGRPGAVRKLRESEQNVALLRVAEAEWQTLQSLRNAWLAWSVASSRLHLLEGHIAALAEFAHVAESLSEAGELDPSGARLFSIEHGRSLAARERLVQDIESQRLALLATLGLLPDAPATLLPVTSIESGTTTADPTIHPAVQRLAAEYRVAEAALRLELRKQYPDLTLSPTYADEEDETALTLGLGLPIPVWNANRQEIAAAAAQRDAARARVESALQQAMATLAQADARLAGADAQRRILEAKVAPMADLQLEQARALLAVGEMDVVPMYEALRQTHAIKEELLEALLEAMQARVIRNALLQPTPYNVNNDGELTP